MQPQMKTIIYIFNYINNHGIDSVLMEYTIAYMEVVGSGCLTASSHYLSQICLIISEVSWRTPNSNFANFHDIYLWSLKMSNLRLQSQLSVANELILNSPANLVLVQSQTTEIKNKLSLTGPLQWCCFSTHLFVYATKVLMRSHLDDLHSITFWRPLNLINHI